MENIYPKDLKLIHFITLIYYSIYTVQCSDLSGCRTSCHNIEPDGPCISAESNSSCLHGCMSWKRTAQNCMRVCNISSWKICERKACEHGCSYILQSYDKGVLGSKNTEWLFLSRYNSLRKKFLQRQWDTAACMPPENLLGNITGITLNFYKQHVYFSERHHIWMKGALNITDISDLRPFYAGLGSITAVSVDWLYQKMYFVMNEKILYCDLNNCRVIEDTGFPLPKALRKIVADPLNGYLFVLTDDGIYRMELPQSAASKKTVSLIVKSSSLKDFSLNFTSKRIIYYNECNKSIESVFIDGSDLQQVRPPQLTFTQCVSLSFADKMLFLTDGERVYKEETLDGNYFYNEYLIECDLITIDACGFSNLQSYGESAQPYPIPEQPQQLMVLFGSDTAAIKWRKPQLPTTASPSAWQKWIYTVRVSSEHHEDAFFSDITNTNFTVRYLNSSTKYRISVMAMSAGGKSPWTEAFIGTTLKQADEEPYILAAGSAGLWKEHLGSFDSGNLHFPNMTHVNDMDWYNDTLFWTDTFGKVHIVPLSNCSRQCLMFQINDTYKAGALSFEWLGQTLYWADTTNHTIYRTSVRGTELVTTVKHAVNSLVVDSISAYLYWASSIFVESKRLDGNDYLLLQDLKEFSGKQVTGLTLDLNNGFLYWLVHDAALLHLYRTGLRRHSIHDNMVTEFSMWSSSKVSETGLQYYSDWLFWINGDGDLTAQEFNQTVNNPYWGADTFESFTLIQKSLKPLPDGFSYIPTVIPVSVPESSIRITGNYSAFSVVWNANSNVDFGTVFYCVRINALQTSQDVFTRSCLPPYNLTMPVYPVEGMDPYSLFTFSITPYTYWGLGPTVKISLRAPEGVPTAPEKPRICVTNDNIFEEYRSIILELRWDVPLKENGVLLKYRLYYTVLNATDAANNTTRWNTTDVPSSVTSYFLNNMSAGLTVLFQVQAYTSVGPGPMSDMAKANTAVPDAAVNVTLCVVSDVAITVSWSDPLQPNGPLETIRYQVAVRPKLPSLYPEKPWQKNDFPDGVLALTISDFLGGLSYSFQVMSFHPDENWFSISDPVIATTFQTPMAPSKIIPGNISVQLEWSAPTDNSTVRYWFELTEEKTENRWVSLHHECIENSIYSCTLSNVYPNKMYSGRVAVEYHTGAKSFSKPFNFVTLAGVPSKPGVPKQMIGQQIIVWEMAASNGYPIIYYNLEAKKLVEEHSRATNSELSTWNVVYKNSCNTSLCTWKTEKLEGTFQFRVAAANQIGLGDYSNVSGSIILNVKGSDSSFTDVIIAVAVVFGVVTAVITTSVFVCYRKTNKKNTQHNQHMLFFKSDPELDNLRGISAMTGLSSACYAVSCFPSQSDISSLPAFPRERLKLCSLLGSGAFGEVYEGVATGIQGQGSGEYRVAVKTLKKGATDHEKAEFLKEAHLMSQFDHPHILKLVGVCLLNEPQYIILELMEGGDLRTYLQGARANQMHGPLLSMSDLLDICLDVSKGCAYLEKQHFVHRDLAGRNCLVSVKRYDDPSRIVKIGDFGLTRDIYHNDYYRKRGEGFLPVRWMSPESLVDGVFTRHSDVWAFGVLLWEIITMGQQPYPGYSNVEVLHLVCSGRRLEFPSNCPDDFCDMMLKCWQQEPTSRPSFRCIQDQLERLKSAPLRYSNKNDDRPAFSGIINQAFEDTDHDLQCDSADGIRCTTLTERKNSEGLNYLVITPERQQQMLSDHEDSSDIKRENEPEATLDPSKKFKASSEPSVNYLVLNPSYGNPEYLVQQKETLT